MGFTVVVVWHPILRTVFFSQFSYLSRENEPRFITGGTAERAPSLCTTLLILHYCCIYKRQWYVTCYCHYCCCCCCYMICQKLFASSPAQQADSRVDVSTINNYSTYDATVASSGGWELQYILVGGTRRGIGYVILLFAC